LKFDFLCFYEDKDNIGKRYRRMNAVTVDHQILQDDTVDIRDRDTMKHERLAISSLKSINARFCFDDEFVEENVNCLKLHATCCKPIRPDG
jgi:glycyl-tRNA synthetase (class II)